MSWMMISKGRGRSIASLVEPSDLLTSDEEPAAMLSTGCKSLGRGKTSSFLRKYTSGQWPFEVLIFLCCSHRDFTAKKFNEWTWKRERQCRWAFVFGWRGTKWQYERMVLQGSERISPRYYHHRIVVKKKISYCNISPLDEFRSVLSR